MSIRQIARLFGPALLCAIIASASICFAQDKPAPADDGVLAGPKVHDKPPAAGEDMMRSGGGGAGRDGKRRTPDVPFQQWMGALRGLGLSEDQQDQVRTISTEFETATHEYEQSLSEADRQMIQTVREARKSGNPPPPESRDKMKKIDDARPKPGAYQERIWAVLTDEQQVQMKSKLEELRQKMIERRGEGGEGGGGGGPDRRDSMDNMYEGRRRGAGQPESDARSQQPQPTESPRAGNTNRTADSSGFDELGQRRLRFLMSKQSKEVRQPGRDASPDERRFRFDEDQPEPPATEQPAPDRPSR